MQTNVFVPPLVKRQCRPDELSFIYSRIYDLSAKELLVFKGALNLEPANTPRDFINRSYQLEGYRLCLGASDTEALGKFSRLYLGGGDEYSDQELGIQARERMPDGVFIDGSYIYKYENDNYSPYDGGNLSELSDDFYSVKLRLGSPDKRRFCFLRLPDMSLALGMPDEVAAAEAALGVGSISECRLVDAKCMLPDIGDLTEEYEGRISDLIDDGNHLAYTCDQYDYEAAMRDNPGCNLLREVLDIPLQHIRREPEMGMT